MTSIPDIDRIEIDRLVHMPGIRLDLTMDEAIVLRDVLNKVDHAPLTFPQMELSPRYQMLRMVRDGLTTAVGVSDNDTKDDIKGRIEFHLPREEPC